MDIVRSVQEAVAETVEQAKLAHQQGTFSVGGILIDVVGNVYKAMHNNVVKNDFLYDPTAHGERQLVDWYFENRARLNLPDPDRMIIVTSLDPCAMCTGAILEAGFDIAIISAYDIFAGINYNKQADFPTFSGFPQLMNGVSFAYPKITGTSAVSRPSSGPKMYLVKHYFRNREDIEDNTGLLSSTLFQSTLQEVQEKINRDSIPPEQLEDLALEGPSNWVYQEVISRFPNAFRYKAPLPKDPDEGLIPFINKASMEDRENGGNGDCVAFLDYFGNLLFCTPGTENVSPIQTAFMKATRMYAELRYDIGTRSANSLRYLCHPKYGTFIYKNKPLVSYKTLMNMGAYGSTMEGEIPDNRQLQYILQPDPDTGLEKLIRQMPPFYTDLVKISISQVTNPNLRNMNDPRL